MQSKSQIMNSEPWTRQEDTFLLQSIKKEYSENSFLLISKTLQNRTVDEVIFIISEDFLYIYI